MDDRGRAKTCLVGEDTAGYAKTQGLCYRITSDTSNRCVRGESIPEDLAHGSRKLGYIDSQDYYCHDNVENDHDRDQCLGNPSDNLDATDDN